MMLHALTLKKIQKSRMQEPFLDCVHATIAWRMLQTGTFWLIHTNSTKWRPHVASIVRAIERDHKTHPLRDLLIYTIWLCNSHMCEPDLTVLLSTTYASFFSDTIFATSIDWHVVDTVSMHAKRRSKKLKRTRNER